MAVNCCSKVLECYRQVIRQESLFINYFINDWLRIEKINVCDAIFYCF